MALIPMWVNQPSTLQPDHALHGTNVLMEEEEGICAYIWFMKNGVFESMRIEKRSLSKGQLRPKQPGQHEKAAQAPSPDTRTGSTGERDSA